ncbi:S-adenosyl-L-methionine-dependent methyltransferase [Fomitiporia mediterranea MF3/22]|uniref:S-adenosyl-L-methionine-dependent methyltransferase n=1 Tax=Fomitiporia mediterranea (strain MF3/22) TaxID=694068 RepID=UPI0004407779|nr:S-adenosyl-L-methionine-dependent methyltransferase [Fomitiporia mediterranea MF3/22]EJD05856.1 S-adenosyl-L-methionine-dependent methyltransferase [Fomitiporia mediterranea MF3/22]
MTNKAVIATTASEESPDVYEDNHVHSVYDTIAHHFSSTRYKPWPVVAGFLASIPPGWIGLDAGCGNGKYLISPNDREGMYWTVGLDRSAPLLDFAKHAGGRERECVLGDVLHTPWRSGVFDFGISIATIHHLSTPERRKRSIQSLLKCLSPAHGRGLIYVWAIQQDELSKRSIPDVAEDSNTQDKGQDVFIPWVLSQNSASGRSDRARPDQSQHSRLDDAEQGSERSAAVFNRYYHMFDRGELRELVLTAAGEMGIRLESRGTDSPTSSYINVPSRQSVIEILKDDWERSNYYVEFRLYQR